MSPQIKAMVRRLLPRRLKPHRIMSGPNRGSIMVTSWHDYPAAILGYCEGPLLGWLSQHVRPGETWIDVGAHYGNTALRMCDRVGRAGRVFAFEPNLASAGCLAQARRLNGLSQLTILPFGLSTGTGISPINLPEVRGMVDSTLKPEEAEFFETILVVPFAELWPQINSGNARIDGIKIDVQGMELSVLRGLAPILASQRPQLIVEVHAGVSRPELVALLNELGYHGKPLPIEPVAGETEAQLIDNRIYHFPVA